MDRQPEIIKVFDNWRTIYPKGTDELSETFYEANDLMHSNPKKAEKIFKKIISVCGNGHVDAILHLGLLNNNIENPIEGNALITKAYKIAIEAFPDNFNEDLDKLDWDYLENKPILRAIHAYGLELMKDNNYEKAIKEFNFILKVNPQDNQGVRYLIIDCLFALDKPTEILVLDKLYDDDYSVEFLYGKFLALYLLDRKDEAKQQFKKAKKAFPFVAEELVKKTHVFPVNEFDTLYFMEGFPNGSRQQAYEYWLRTHDFWNKAQNIYEFISNTY